MIQNFINVNFFEKNIRNIPSEQSIRTFKKSSANTLTIPDIENEFDPDEETKREHLIICKFCHHLITSLNNVIDINGSHTHICTNPAGKTYTIGCFSEARGCLNIGESTIEYTWFPGFIWNYAICSLCHNHLGWFYLSDKNSFYGLILDNLIENI